MLPSLIRRRCLGRLRLGGSSLRGRLDRSGLRRGGLRRRLGRAGLRCRTGLRRWCGRRRLGRAGLRCRTGLGRWCGRRRLGRAGRGRRSGLRRWRGGLHRWRGGRCWRRRGLAARCRLLRNRAQRGSRSCLRRKAFGTSQVQPRPAHRCFHFAHHVGECREVRELAPDIVNGLRCFRERLIQGAQRSIKLLRQVGRILVLHILRHDHPPCDALPEPQALEPLLSSRLSTKLLRLEHRGIPLFRRGPRSSRPRSTRSMPACYYRSA